MIPIVNRIMPKGRFADGSVTKSALSHKCLVKLADWKWSHGAQLVRFRSFRDIEANHAAIGRGHCGPAKTDARARLPNVPGRKSNHQDRRDYQQAHLQPKIIGKAVFVCDLRIHDCDHLLPIGRRRINDPREATRQREKALLPVAPLSRFFGFRHCHPACLAVVSA